MSVLSTYGAFRNKFAKVITSPSAMQSLSFTAPGTIARLAGDFTADGVEAGMRCDVYGTVNNNGSHGLVTNVAVLSLTVDGGVTVNEGAAIGPECRCAFIEPSGWEQWQSALVNVAGFNAGFTGLSYAVDTLTVSCNSGAADGVFGTGEYNWYLSQRTDAPTEQMWAIAQKPDAGGNSYSGTVIIQATALAGVEHGIVPSLPMTGDQAREMLTRVYLYVQRISDDKIQWIHLLDELSK